ncbi:MAG: metallophosphoesterase [Opitutaceae bacterium]
MSRFALWFALLTAAVAAPAAPEAILVVTGDQHSAYERSAQFVARVDSLRAAHPGVPFAVLINGDSLEYGNAVARRSSGAVDFAVFAALARRVPVVINLGNHEPEFFDVPETVRRLRAAGLQVISGNLRNPADGKPYADASVRLRLGAREFNVVGVTTDRLSTYRVAIRPQLDLADPVVWARANFPAILREDGPTSVVLSHCGLKADRAMLPLVPAGTLFAGAHDHLRFVHQEGRTVYFHSGSWMEFISVARLEKTAGALAWTVTHEALGETPADPEIAGLVRETLAQHLTAEEREMVGQTPRALGPGEAARFVVEAARVATQADAAMVGATTFGAGLPAGAITRFAFDACVRFDGPLFSADVDGAWLRRLVARSNQGPETPWEKRSGENLVTVAPEVIDDRSRYRFVTTDWVARNAAAYLGENPPPLVQHPSAKLKAAAQAALQASKK